MVKPRTTPLGWGKSIAADTPTWSNAIGVAGSPGCKSGQAGTALPSTTIVAWASLASVVMLAAKNKSEPERRTANLRIPSQSHVPREISHQSRPFTGAAETS